MKKLLLVASILVSGAMFAGSFEEQLRKVTGVDVITLQPSREKVVVSLPEAFGVFTNATVFTDKNGSGLIKQIRCVRDYAADVKPEVVKADVDAAVELLKKSFAVAGVKIVKDDACTHRTKIVFADTDWYANAYVTEAKHKSEPLGYYIADLTFVKGR